MLRRATERDIDAVNRLLATEGRLALTTDLEESIVLIKDDGSAMGSLHVYRDLGRWSARMSSLIVAPEARGKGLAKEVVRERIEIARSIGQMRVLASHGPDRPATRSILESQGMRELREQTFFGIDV